MVAAILFPDPIPTVRAWLAVKMPAVQVVQRRPAAAPVELVQVVRTGGQRAHLVADDAQLTVTCWAATDPASADLAARVRAWLLAMAGEKVGTVAVYRVAEVGGLYANPDPDSGSPRHTFTVAVQVRGAALP